MLHDAATPLLWDLLRDSARKWSDKEALTCQGERITYSELCARSNALANALVARGVERGDRVVVFADNTVETAIAFWAVLKANAIVSIVNPLTKTDKLAYVLDDCRAKALITDAHVASVFLPAARRARHLALTVVSGTCDEGTRDLRGFVPWNQALSQGERARAPERRSIDVDLASIIYTSGSTGDPKGVMLTHRNMLTASASIATYLELGARDVILCVLPMAFDYGLYQMILSVRVGARLVLERSFAFPAQVLELARDEEVTVFPGVPTIFSLLGAMHEARELHSVRTVTNTAAALAEKNIATARRFFPRARIFSMYGLTECKRCTYLPPEDIARKPTSVGVAIPNTELWLVDEGGRRIHEPNRVGQLVIRGATVMKGYWEKPEETAKKLRPGPIPGEQVLYTGDLCKLDEEGYLYFVARMDDIIKTRGEKVSPVEVERAIGHIPGVRECAVIGVADEVLGQAVKAFVVLDRGATIGAREIQKHASAVLESFMVPKHVEIVAELPRGLTGKIQKTALT